MLGVIEARPGISNATGERAVSSNHLNFAASDSVVEYFETEGRARKLKVGADKS